MLTKIIQFSVSNKLVIGLFILLWILYGGYQVTQLPIDAVPDITNNQVQIITSAPSLAAEDVERLITFPLEQAISTIPGLKESRSMSRFGLSLVTIVFNDDADIYWARQQVTERISQVEISENASTPQLAPPTTGLGEIYQYVLKPKKGYQGKFSLSDLRTTQDWLVRRQLLSTPGVADVSTFGGDLKQYEVAVIPANLKAMNLTISDIILALKKNNQNTGGAYIEKGPSVLYIRSVGLAGSMDDISQIVVKNNANGTPILMSHVAELRQGSAIRYGALTMAGEGELCGGIVMMLKGANSSEVIENVKNRVQEIQKTLPEGLEIEPFLDRTKMVNNAIRTVENNLLEGALIVVLLLVLFLGNLRAGLIVASVIPLSMLFAISMMNLFGVSGNLMSLGALDFGLIIDGAVIIVEAILHHIHTRNNAGYRLSQNEMDAEVTGSASRMMNAAFFGQIIILIVYLPILSLAGIEGKMFKPMAQTVAFAIVGAFILSLTYVPMISALCISKKVSTKANLSDRLMARIEKVYASWLITLLQFKKLLVLAAFALFALSLVIFSKMGGEFIPQLEEGDFATETRLLVGTNLSTTIAAFNKIGDKLKADYPEVEKIVSRIGSAEIPTDPMPIEGGDMIIVLKDKSEWTSANSFAELATKMGATAQQVVPGVTTGFQYPVQMRFNELMTGAKQDVVCKIFGEDLDKLAEYANRLGSIAKTVKGSTDWYIEKVTGMPQVVVEFNRKEIAKFGLTIEEINSTINAAFAGASAGQIYEGEKKFDLVVRVGSEGRRSIEDVRNLLIATPGGMQIPLYQVASIEEIEGPNQIQRENTRRRILVGFNVRGRDVQSIVEELQKKVDTEMKLDPGYSITYGGAFENLQQAKSRLLIAVPVALLLIFGMLYFAFSSIKDGALIYTAIPLSAIGGVFALYLRDLPFSISAGVGFIALFGVAVLNGIVLLSEFNRIKKEGQVTDTLQLVLQGTRNRLRPVLMTAAVASMGFLPMALSNGAGAEVQRPLATVVIGGLITATLLTLFVLPALYILFEKPIKLSKTALLLILSGGLSFTSFAQNPEPIPIELTSAIQLGLEKNKVIQSARTNEKVAEKLQSSAFDIAKTNVSADYGKMNSIYNDTRIGISQTFSLPAVYTNQRKLLATNNLIAQSQTKLSELDLRTAIRQVFYAYAVLHERQKLLMYTDSIYRLFEAKSKLRFDKGANNLLEKTAAETKRRKTTNQLNLLSADLEVVTKHFNLLIQDSRYFIPKITDPKIAHSLLTHDFSASVDELPLAVLAHQQQEAATFRWQTEKSKMLPEFTIGYNNLSIIGNQQIGEQTHFYNGNKRFSYVNFGVSFPLFYKASTARAASEKLAIEKSRQQAESVELQLINERNIAIDQVRKYEKSLSYFLSDGLTNAEIILHTAEKQFQEGEIDYLQWVIIVDQALDIKSEYLNTLSDYNTSVIQLLKATNL